MDVRRLAQGLAHTGWVTINYGCANSLRDRWTPPGQVTNGFRSPSLSLL